MSGVSNRADGCIRISMTELSRQKYANDGEHRCSECPKFENAWCKIIAKCRRPCDAACKFGILLILKRRG